MSIRRHISKLLYCLLLALLPLAANANTKFTYFVNDAVGSPVVAMNQAGAVVWRKAYQPYGKASGKDRDNRIGYTGHVEDQPDLVYAGARYYDPALGRFLSDDPVRFTEKNPMSFNRYAYANNNPYKFVDPDGREFKFADDEIKQHYNQTKQYLDKAGVGGVLDKIEGDKKHIVTVVETAFDSSYDVTNNILYWNPYQGQRTPDGGTQSPALGFLHEAAHALGDITGKMASMRDIPGNLYNSKEEERIIEGYEVPAAKKLGEGIRHDHKLRPLNVKCSICR